MPLKAGEIIRVIETDGWVSQPTAGNAAMPKLNEGQRLPSIVALAVCSS